MKFWLQEINRHLNKMIQADRNLCRLCSHARGRRYDHRRANYWARTWSRHKLRAHRIYFANH